MLARTEHGIHSYNSVDICRGTDRESILLFALISGGLFYVLFPLILLQHSQEGSRAVARGSGAICLCLLLKKKYGMPYLQWTVF